MWRVVDLTIRPYPCPEMNVAAAAHPVYGWRPEPPIIYEPVSRERAVANILCRYDLRFSMIGVQALDSYNSGFTTTKPYTSVATFHNPSRRSNWDPEFLADIPVARLTGRAKVISLVGDVRPGESIGAEKLARGAPGPIERGDLVFIRTDYSKTRPPTPTSAYFENSPSLNEEAARWLAEREVSAVAADVRCLDPRYTLKGKGPDVYGILNSVGAVVIEDLVNLERLERPRDFCIIGFPLPFRWVTGGPVRIFAVNLENPSDFVDLTPRLDIYPGPAPSYPVPWQPPEPKDRGPLGVPEMPNPVPGRMEPMEYIGTVMKQSKLIPFRIVDETGRIIGEEFYIEWGHGAVTHIEGPFWDPWGRLNISDDVLRQNVWMPTEKLFGEACLFDLANEIGPRQLIEPEHLQEANPGVKAGDIVLIRAAITEWWHYGGGDNITPGFSAEAIRWFLERKIKTLVLDFPSVERSEPPGGLHRITPNIRHGMLYRHNIPMVDHATNLRDLRKKRFLAAIMSLPISHQEGHPAHVMAIEKWD